MNARRPGTCLNQRTGTAAEGAQAVLALVRAQLLQQRGIDLKVVGTLSTILNEAVDDGLQDAIADRRGRIRRHPPRAPSFREDRRGSTPTVMIALSRMCARCAANVGVRV